MTCELKAFLMSSFVDRVLLLFKMLPMIKIRYFKVKITFMCINGMILSYRFKVCSLIEYYREIEFGLSVAQCKFSDLRGKDFGIWGDFQSSGKILGQWGESPN